ncbi:Protein of unknown function DUF2237 [Cyanobacterium stanieri PCC 7202]|uniref:DUF2237 domain-containing protein n=1 Tax=Cyanobacterium stanieri (strain ATCC 29140 / PCC 7202) TaxID=292563 RepID=K9YPB4_CYASC|nr:Protein of unknown function DUF2237 [Cyanobacterium stanieri PCC 7202]
MTNSKNVLGKPLETCCQSPMTGFYRNGCCDTGAEDFGLHTVCAQVSAEFLEYSKNKGNDLITPMPMYNFPGLKPGDKWCLCVSRWQEALEAGVAPPIILASTHEKTLQFVPLEVLQEHSI